jgi:hypothetical protein
LRKGYFFKTVHCVLFLKWKLYANAVDANLARMYCEASFLQHADLTMTLINVLACIVGLIALPLMAWYVVRTAKPMSEMTPKEIEMHQDLTAI